MTNFTCPEFTELDQELKDDFYGSTQESIEIMDACVDRLAQDSNSGDLNELFRSMHSVKGNCNMVFIAPIVEALHELEELVTDIRDETYPYHPNYGQFIQAVIHETDEVLRDLMNTDVASQTTLNQLEFLISALHQCDDDNTRIHIAECATHAILQGHFSLEQAMQEFEEKNKKVIPELVGTTESNQKKTSSALEFFRELAENSHVLDPWRGVRLERTLSLCRELNSIYGEVIDPEQLLAAIYVHEFTMGMVPNEIMNQAAELDDTQKEIVHRHVSMGVGLLKQVPGFDEAAEIIQFHHEQIDGKGYPSGHKGPIECVGAVILAMVDTFMSITSDRPDRPYKKTLLTAVKEINKSQGFQFSAEHVAGFNEVIKKSYITQAKW
ncbi:MAG: hypothetical protein COW84_02030 [Gammaproteobacteria bacterium CG22_combo_CG10-13_8_21_14_all_40_8]|nr:MAG: hypothetical protein COW84_02030 [Gammaproteobacteria bacterium CG22_combo_CG10-13_8_21_14_all_40_8]